MGFLSGVLSNIHKHLGQHNGQITDAINTLNKNKHSGKKGFNDAIVKVVKGVREYNERVRESNEKINGVIMTFTRQMKSYSKDALTEILPEKDSFGKPIVHGTHQIDKAVTEVDNKRETECVGFVKTFFKGIASAKDDIKDLTDDLELRVNNAKENILHEYNRLSDIHKQQKSYLTAVTANIQKQSKQTEEQIHSTVQKDVSALVEMLRKSVAEIRSKLEKISESLRVYISALDTWIKEVNEIVREAEEKVEKILEQIDGDNAQKKKNIDTATAVIKGQVMTLHEKFEAVNKKYNGVYENIRGRDGRDGKETVVGKLHEVQSKVKVPDKLPEFMNPRNEAWDVSAQIKPLLEKIKENVKQFAEKLSEALKDGVDKAKDTWNSGDIPGLEALNNKVKENPELKKLGARISAAVLDTDNLGPNLERFFTNLQNARDEWQGNPTASKTYENLLSDLKSDLETHSIDVNNEMFNLIFGSVSKAIGNLQKAVTAIVESDLKKIDKIEDTLVQEADSTKQSIEQQATQVTENLKAICEAILKLAEKDDESAKRKLNEVRKRIGRTIPGYKETLQIHHDNLHKLRTGELNNAINAAQNFDVDAEQGRKATIRKLNAFVTTQIETSRDTITNDIKSRYVKFIKLQLTAFADKVTKELDKLPGEIKMDADKGFKGFMAVFQQQLTASKLLTELLDLDNLETLSRRAKTFFTTLIKTLMKKNNIMPAIKLSLLYTSLEVLFNNFTKYNRRFVTNLSELNKLLTDINPKSYSHQNNPLLQILKRGVTDLHDELGKAYISVYDGASNINWDQANNPETTYCAKIFCTLLQPLFDGLHELRQHCAIKAAWEDKTISLTEAAPHGNTITNPLGRFFQRCGYTVCSGPNKHNGELRNTAECRGGHIHKKLDGGIRGIDGKEYKLVTEYDEKKDEESKKKHGLLKKLFDHLHDYYAVRHVSTFSAKTYPTSVYDMLQWLCGLTYNPVHETLSHDGFSALFEKPEDGEAKHHLIDDMSVELEDADSLEAYPQKITAASLSDALAVVCHYSHDVLTTILGHGHDDGVYACDFNTNSGALMYPSNMDTLLCMICDVVNRLYRQLHFLYNQCQYNTELSGWLDCEYGQGVGGSGWRCNVDQCVNQTCNQKGGQRANQNGNQRADQRCDQHPKCGVKSPLQSFLEDGLQGFLPHQLKYEKGKVSCSVKDHSGIECITPLGFSGISRMASHRATGQRIVDVLAGYCGNPTSPLTKLCSLFNCVIPTPPKTLGQMFGFYYSLLVDWDDSSKRNTKREAHREAAFNKAVSDADFANTETTLDMTSMFRNGKHNPSPADQSSTHLTGDLYALVRCNGKSASDPSHPCGTYLRPLCYDTCAMFSKEHADKYLSWIVYLTETFYTSLQKLLEDCQKTCGADSRKCKIGKCNKDCKTKKLPLSTTAEHGDSCKSIVECGYIRPTFFRWFHTQ